MEDDLGMMEDDLFKLLITLGSFCADTVLVSNRVTNFIEILLRDIRRRKPTMTSTLSGKTEVRASFGHFFVWVKNNASCAMRAAVFGDNTMLGEFCGIVNVSDNEEYAETIDGVHGAGLVLVSGQEDDQSAW